MLFMCYVVCYSVLKALLYVFVSCAPARSPRRASPPAASSDLRQICVRFPSDLRQIYSALIWFGLVCFLFAVL